MSHPGLLQKFGMTRSYSTGRCIKKGIPGGSTWTMWCLALRSGHFPQALAGSNTKTIVRDPGIERIRRIRTNIAHIVVSAHLRHCAQ